MSEVKTWRKIKSLRKYLNGISPEDFALKSIKEKVEINEIRLAERLFTYRYDFNAFCKEVLKAESWGEPPHQWGKVHNDLTRFIRTCKNLGENAFIQIPRYHLKTQICTIFYRIWRLVHDPELCSLIVSGTLELSKGTARAIKRELEFNLELRKLYQHVLPDIIFNDKKNKWSEAQFNVYRSNSYPQCSIEAVGVEATVTGKHFGEISMDDLVTPENSTTAEQCQKVIQAYRYFISIKNPTDMRGRIPIMVVGTPYKDNDLYTFIQDPSIISNFRLFKRPVFDQNDEPIWPEMFSKKRLQEIASIQGPYVFASQYLLDVVPEGEQEFRKSWIQIYKSVPCDLNGQEIYLTKYMIVDPITMKKTNSSSPDRGVVLVVGVDKASNWYILDYKLFSRAKEGEMFKGIFELSDKWKCYSVGWESVAYQLQGKYNLEEEAARSGNRLRVIELRPGHTDKDTRIRALIPYFERGQIFIRPWMIELIQELQRFPLGQTKDILDSLAYMIKMIPAPKKKSFGAWANQTQKQATYF